MSLVSRTDFIYLAAGVAAVLMALVGPQSAFAVGMVTVPLALVFLSRRLSKRKGAPSRLTMARYAALFLLLAAGPGGCAVGNYRVEKAAVPLIGAIEEYHTRYGAYPRNDEVEPLLKKTVCPTADRRFRYTVFNGGKEYHLTCLTYAFNKHTFSSSTKEWVDWD